MASKKDIVVKNVVTIDIKPVVSEKSYTLANEQNKYVFMVPLNTSKVQVRKSVESKYKVNVTSVNVITRPGKSKMNWQYNVKNRLSDSKKAVVTLKSGDKIDEFFNL